MNKYQNKQYPVKNVPENLKHLPKQSTYLNQFKSNPLEKSWNRNWDENGDELCTKLAQSTTNNWLYNFVIKLAYSMDEKFQNLPTTCLFCGKFSIH